jgi:UDP-3-O-acyl-N-acetylglucosamine deacetylase
MWSDNINALTLEDVSIVIEHFSVPILHGSANLLLEFIFHVERLTIHNDYKQRLVVKNVVLLMTMSLQKRIKILLLKNGKAIQAKYI